MQLEQALAFGALSDTGRVRSHNEDSVVVKPPIGLVALADGMGGYNAGEVASGLATEILAREVESHWRTLAGSGDREGCKASAEALFRTHIQTANQAIYRKAQSDRQCAGMGTTLVAGLFLDDFLTLAHLGDSRAYRLRQQLLEQITRDHSLLQEQLDSGLITADEARVSHNRNFVTRALGVDAVAETETHSYEVLPGDCYLFCSDGLNDVVSDDDIRRALLALRDDPQQAAEFLVKAANDGGGRDNISVVVAAVRAPFAVERARPWRLRSLLSRLGSR